VTATEKEYIALVCLAAALADERLEAGERRRIRRVVEELGGVEVRDLFGRVFDRRLDPVDLAVGIQTPWGRRTAYHMAVIVCQCDGPVNEAEAGFLERLREALALSDAAAAGLRIEAEHYLEPGLPPVVTSRTSDDPDRMILRYAILAAAAELLPQTVASLVVIPLQVKLVYVLGQRHGAGGTMEQGKELVAALGIGATSQVVESLARRVLGGVARQVGGTVVGRMLGGMTAVATGAAISFATTYALGHATETYYRRGRTLTPADLRALFQRFQEEARTIYPRVEAEIRAQAESLDLEQLVGRVRGVV
jgi:uncharacterized protein (DUF697 family)